MKVLIRIYKKNRIFRRKYPLRMSQNSYFTTKFEHVHANKNNAKAQKIGKLVYRYILAILQLSKGTQANRQADIGFQQRSIKPQLAPFN